MTRKDSLGKGSLTVGKLDAVNAYENPLMRWEKDLSSGYTQMVLTVFPQRCQK